MRFTLFAVAALLLATSAFGAGKGHYYLKISGGPAKEYNSAAACEQARLKYEANWKRMVNALRKRMHGDGGGKFGDGGHPYCLNFKPNSYEQSQTVIWRGPPKRN